MKHTLTLSRWHKVAERLHAAMKEREAAVKTAYTATAISPWNKAAVEEKAAEIARRAAEDLALVETAAQSVATIRAALALRNAALGVSARLAEAESAKRRAALYRTIVEGQKADMVRPEDVRTLPAELVGETESWGFGRRTALAVTLQTADPALLAELRAKLAREARARRGARNAAPGRGRRSKPRAARDRRAGRARTNRGAGGVIRAAARRCRPPGARRVPARGRGVAFRHLYMNGIRHPGRARAR